MSRRVNLVNCRQLWGGEEGLEAMERSTNLPISQEEPEVKLSHIAASVDKGVHMLLEQKVLQHSTLGHEPEKIEVAAKELHAGTQQ